jgi:Transposase DDE domain group 1
LRVVLFCPSGGHVSEDSQAFLTNLPFSSVLLVKTPYESGLKQFPDQTALRRYLRRLSPKAIRQLARLHDQMRSQLFDLPQARTSLTFHLDSVVLTLYGKQQGARLGYNPKKKGRPSYHPLLCFEAHGQEFWHGSLRPGDAAAHTGARALVGRCLQKVPSSIARSRIRLLADAGFFSGRLVDDLDQAGCGYIIVCSKAKSYLPMAERAGFKVLSFGWAVAEFRFKPQRWTAEHRFIMVRRPVPEDPQEAEQLTLFRQGRYSYSGLVTNLELQPWMVWKTYSCARQCGEVDPGTAELFRAEQNPDARMGGQCSVSATAAFRLQHRALVQAPVFVPRLPARDRGDHSAGVLGVAGETDQTWRSECVAVAPRLSSPPDVPGGGARDPKSAASGT